MRVMATSTTAFAEKRPNAACEDAYENGKRNHMRSVDRRHRDEQSVPTKCEGPIFPKGPLNCFFRDTTTSIADALLELGSAEDCTGTSSSIPTAKRARSFVSDGSATASILYAARTESETDIKSTDKRTKRPRTEETKTCYPLPIVKPRLPCSPQLVPSMYGNNEGKFALSFSVTEFQLRNQNFDKTTVPGEMGCISTSFQDFRPMRAPPRFPTAVIPPYIPPPPLPQIHPTEIIPKLSPRLSSSLITEHNDCVIMHSYTILPKQIPHPTPRTLLLNDFLPSASTASEHESPV
eukprot:CAMPEP_0172355792 /NCGR_PEP_ID=MMETSP1060-20121228/190_1 /TAXON_ID=37318 /ORGANISM="Pseudo-nitzschia pungens, Strain cf. cingulata" /LENGTH=292 /DNA_ID=CAMNT_0013075639 /DNA_START=139 /DNA_END=1014 /DNA_ORIENTATION=-